MICDYRERPQRAALLRGGREVSLGPEWLKVSCVVGVFFFWAKIEESEWEKYPPFNWEFGTHSGP